MFDRMIDRIMGRGDAAVTTPPMDGALRPNQRLEELDATPAPAPDDLAEWGGAIVYSSGRELRDVKNGSVLRTFDAPITCLGAGGSALAIGLSGSGLHLLHADGSIAQVNSGKLRNPTAVAFAGDDIVACEGSTKRAPDEWKRDLMEAGYAGPGTGSVWIFGRDRSGRRLANGLRYPNGIIAGAQGTIVVSESWSHRLVAVDPRGGLVRVVLPDLPGYPARMACASDGGVWLSIFAPRSQLIEFVLREPAYRRRMMAEINPDYWIAPALANSRSFLEPLQGGGVKQMGVLKPWAPSRSYGLVVKLDAAWQPVLSLHSRADGTRHGTTSVLEMEGNLYIASKGGDAILSVPVEELIET